MQRLNSYLHTKDSPPYILNLDPAVTHMPYSANIDIRDTVDYKEVMKQYVYHFFVHQLEFRGILFRVLLMNVPSDTIWVPMEVS